MSLADLELKAQQQQLRYALNALKRIATGNTPGYEADKFAEIALKHIMGPQAAMQYISERS
jgi:hypothetical protein